MGVVCFVCTNVFMSYIHVSLWRSMYVQYVCVRVCVRDPLALLAVTSYLGSWL